MSRDLLAEIELVESDGSTDSGLEELNTAVAKLTQKLGQYKRLLSQSKDKLVSQETLITELEQKMELRKQKMGVIEEHNRRLFQQYTKMKKQRETDFKTIKMWQEALGIENKDGGKDNSKDNTNNKEESNVKTRKRERDEKKEELDSELTQDTGPNSELTQDTGAPNSELTDSLPPSSPQLLAKRFKPELSASQMSQVLIPNSMAGEQYTQSQSEDDPDFDGLDDLAELEIEKNTEEGAFIEEIMNKDWHPVDFKLNSNYSENTKHRNLEFLNTLKRKETRNCMHGTNCKDCANFYKLLNIDGAAQTASRHRHFLPEQESPVGYWRTEFPSSASRDADLAGNQNLISTEGRSRLAEALVNGKYVFRDAKLQKRAIEHMNKLAT